MKSIPTFIATFLVSVGVLLSGCRTNIPLEERRNVMNAHFSQISLTSPQKVRMINYVPFGFILQSDDTVLEGTVTGRITIGANGTVTGVQILQATDGRLVECYRETVSQWTFEPIRSYQGELMSYRLVQPIKFENTKWISDQILKWKGENITIKPCHSLAEFGDYRSLALKG